MNKSFFEKLIYGGGLLFDLSKWLIVALVLVAIVNTFLVAIFVVDGESMESNLHDKELVLWAKSSLVYQNADPKRGEIVLMQYPGDPAHKQYVKRAIGLPGERLSISDGKVYINGSPLSEEYISIDVTTNNDGSWQIPAGQFFLMGDNRDNSNDSRFFGPVEKRFILGKALAVIFPRFLLVKDM
ncbi:MAG: signal peptidase I [bacterium]